MPKPNKHEEWFLIAEEELRSAKILKNAKLFTTAPYHTQQCVEKALMGYLAFKKQPIRKIHDLVLLVEECSKFDATFSSLMSQAVDLKPYITRNRYPDDYVEIEEHEIGDAVEKAQYIFDFVKNKIAGL